MSIDKYKALNREQTIQHTKKRVAAYCRVSTECEDQANSFESQCLFFKQYIEHNPDWELYEIFCSISSIQRLYCKSVKSSLFFKEAIIDDQWIVAMQEELNQFERNNVWELVEKFEISSMILSRG